MTETCPGAAELPRILTLPPDHPLRSHLERCPRCRALHHCYAEFMTPCCAKDQDLEDADSRLAARLQDMLETHRGDDRPKRHGRFFTPRGSMLAAAAVLAICAGIVAIREAALQRDAQLPPGVGLVRSRSADSTDTRWIPAAEGWSLSWNPAIAGQPVLILLDDDLAELARAPIADGLEPADLPSSAAHLRLFFVVAGDTVARSGLVPARPLEP